MFRAMRRKMQQLDIDRAERMLDEATSGTLALIGDGGYPYAVPVSFVRDGSRIYFHGARSGHKYDAIKAEGRASFCVIAADEVVPERYTTHYRSAIAFGRVRIVEDESERDRSIRLLAMRYHPTDSQEHRERYIRDESEFCMFAFEIEHLTGKQSHELALAERNKEA